MSSEVSAETKSNLHLTTSVFVELAPELDTFNTAHHNLFDACRTYAEDVSSDTIWEVEHAQALLEDTLCLTIRAVANSQKYSSDKIRMAHSFYIVQDKLRIEQLRLLAPDAGLKTLEEDNAAAAFDLNARDLLRAIGAEAVISNITSTAVSYLRSDILCFSEAVAVS